MLQETVFEKNEAIESLEDDKVLLLKKLAEASDHIKTIAKEFKDDLDRVEFESSRRVADLKAKLDDVQSENIVLNDRNRTLRKEQIEKTELLNRIEEVKKEKELNIYQQREEKEDLLLQLSKLKSDNDKMKMENHSLKKQWAQTQSEFRTHKVQTTSHSDEATSLRALWQEKSNEFSQMAMVNESLKTQMADFEKKMALVSEMRTDTKQRLNFFFAQIDNMKSKQSENDLRATEAMERAFKKAIEPFSEFDYNL
jgi:chromosome segregation ATPase